MIRLRFKHIKKQQDVVFSCKVSRPRVKYSSFSKRLGFVKDPCAGTKEVSRFILIRSPGLLQCTEHTYLRISLSFSFHWIPIEIFVKRWPLWHLRTTKYSPIQTPEHCFPTSLSKLRKCAGWSIKNI